MPMGKGQMSTSRLQWTSAAVLGLILLLVGAVTACSERVAEGYADHETADTLAAVSLAASANKGPSIVEESSLLSVGTQSDLPKTVVRPPCDGTSDASCALRDVSRFHLFAVIPFGAAYAGEVRVASTEDVLEKGLRLGEASPVHLVVRGTTAGGSTRCDWRGVARTAAQRETAIRFWLGIADSESLPSAAEVERRFMEKLGQLNLALPQTANTSFKVLTQGGLPPFVMPS